MTTSTTLSPQREAFVRAVIAGSNQADAYRTAYPASQKWARGSVHAKASALMADPKVKARYAELVERAADRACLNKANVLEEIRRVALSSVKGIISPEGKILLPHELDDATAASVASFKVDEFGRIEYKFWDKNAALDKAAKVLGLYKEDNKQRADGLSALLGGLSGNVIGPSATPSGDEE